ncbi:RidA family protein [Sphingorhabdus arenilitoris]|uniref:RidA family protein n=1 Tax=Sphingorhabdus arenilitoris TaxID=1490041 RepID=A0ABV8RKC5_9SPHN
MTIEAKLAELGLALPEAAPPVASYVPAVEQGGMLYISGQLPFINGQVMTGKVGDFTNPLGRTMEDGQIAARACALMLIAQMKAALGDLERVERIVKLGVFVASTPDFIQQPMVANGASDLMEAVFGPAGKHARSAVSVPVLPLDATVEIDAIVAVKPK